MRTINNKSLASSNRGISLLSLIITIIVIIILAAVAIVSNYDKNVREANFSKMYNELFEVEAAIAQRGYEHKLDNAIYPYEYKEQYSSAKTTIVNNITYGDGYFLVTPEELETLGVASAAREYVVNYSTGEVILKEPYFWDNKKIHTKEDLLEAYTNNSVITKAEYDKEKGVNKPVLLDGMIPVKFNGTNWIVASKDDIDWYDYSVGSSGGPLRYANVMLMDDTTIRKADGTLLTNEAVRGTNVENLVGMTIENPGSMFVWIPRYTYKDEGGTYSIVYSNLTLDYVANGYTRNPAFYYGEYTGAESTMQNNTGYIAGGRELTGIWISKYTAGYIE